MHKPYTSPTIVVRKPFFVGDNLKPAIGAYIFKICLYFKILFHRYGCVLKIIVFKMSGRNQAFVEFASPVSAHVALLQMDGTLLCTTQAKLKVEFSRQTSLELRQDDNTSRDFIAQPLSAQEQAEIASTALLVHVLKCIKALTMQSDEVVPFSDPSALLMPFNSRVKTNCEWVL
ncbi:unnamed protein product [Dibothriocephalus latus]|uniref:RRM domain-containing protein n=1 Tax=Dibothriocephalus latus TaxID=60516 RepID=A0A3P7NT90_DIBLA|nr:unnamed protein product [Dibothriocephalus latus]